MVAHLPHQNDVRVFTQGAFQGAAETARIVANLAVVYKRAFRRVKKFHRVFDGQNVRRIVFVDVVNHGRKRGRFTRARRAGHQHETFFQFRQTAHDGRQVELFHGRNFGRNHTQNRGGARAVGKGVHTEAGIRAEGDSKVMLQLPFVHGALFFGHDGEEHRANLVGRQGVGLDALKFAVDTHNRLVTAGKVQVGAFVIEREFQKFGNFHGKPPL